MLSTRLSLHCIGRLGRIAQSKRLGSAQNRLFSNNHGKPITDAERQDAIRDANKQLKGYMETRLLAKQGKLKSKRRDKSEQLRKETVMQFSFVFSLLIAFVAAPILGKKIATDDEFREKYVPSWYDFRVKTPESAWTRQELHEQIVQVERDMRERAVRGEFTPDKLEELKRNMQPRSDLSEEDLHYAEKYGWGRLHPGFDPDDEDDFDED